MTARRKSLCKILLLGDGGVGKTALARRFLGEEFLEEYKATIGADIFKHETTIDGQTVVLDVWDTAGQERFRSLGCTFYRGADCCILVYDVTDTKTLRRLDDWKEEFLTQSNQSRPEGFPFVVAGNKADLLPPGQSAMEELGSLSSAPHFQTSAKQDQNVQELFIAAARLAKNKQTADQSDPFLDSIPEDIRLDPTDDLDRDLDRPKVKCKC